MYEQALPLCHFQRWDTRAHTCPGSVSEGMSSSTFPLHQSLLPYPLSHQACPVLLQQEICSPVLLLQNCMCVFLHMCVCVFACSPVKQLPRSDSLLSAWHAWTSGFIVCFEFRSGRWKQHSLNWSAIFPRRLACVASWMLFFQLWTQPERQVLSNNCIQTKYAETWFHKTFAQDQYNYSSSGKFTGRLIFITHVRVTAGVYVLVRSGCGSFHVNMCGGLGISFHTPSQVLL